MLENYDSYITSGQNNLTTGCIAATHKHSTVFVRWRQCAPHLTDASLGLPKSKSQTASWSVQPFCTAYSRVTIFYNGPPLSPLQITPSHGGSEPPFNKTPVPLILNGPLPEQQHPFPLSGTTWVSRYQKGKTNLDFTEARNSGWQWHQLGHMQVCISP